MSMATLKQGGWSRRVKAVSLVVLLLALSAVLSGCFDRNHSPVAVITATPASGEAPLEVTFDASESYDPDSDAITYKWNFGDGEVAQGETIQHGFGTAGSYTVKLQITDSKGKSVTATKAINASQPPNEITKQQTFDLQNGLEYDTGTGLKVSVPPAQTNGKANLMVTENPTPQQRNGEYIELTSVYDISLAQGDASQNLRAISEASVQSQNIKLSFELPSGVDPRAAMVLEWTNEGWALAENQEGIPGGSIALDGEHISVVCKHLSRYALATWLYQHIFSYIDRLPDPPPLEPIFNRGNLSVDDKGKQILECTLKSPTILGPVLPGPGVGGMWYEVWIRDAKELVAADLKAANAWYPYSTVNTKLLPPGAQWSFRFGFENTGGKCKVCLDSGSPDILSVSAADWAERLGLLPEKASLLVSGAKDLLERPGELSSFRAIVWVVKKMMLMALYEVLKEFGVQRAKYLVNLVPVSVDIATYISSRCDGRPDPSFDVSVEGANHLPGPFKVGDVVKVINTGDAGLNLRDAPAGKILKTVPDGWVFKVIEGSKSAALNDEGYRWWKVRAEEYEPTPTEDWVAEDFLEIVTMALMPDTAPDYFTTIHEQVEKAIKWAKSQEGKMDWSGYCLKFVAQAFGQKSSGWASPVDAIGKLGNRFYPVEKCQNPPRGALIFFSAKGKWCGASYGCIDSPDYGHIGIYLGNGEVIHAYGRVRIQTLTAVEQLATTDSKGNKSWIDSYIGWAYPSRGWFETANQLPTVTITSPDNGTTFTEGDVITFQGEATDPEDGALSGFSLVWISSINGQIGAGKSLNISTLSVGTHTITMTATDSDGDSPSASINITVSSAGPTPQPGPSEGKIAFASDRDCQWAEIYVMNADGSNVQRLTYTPGGWASQAPTWSPDGRKIAFISGGDWDGDGYVGLGLCIMDSDGSNVREIRVNTNLPIGYIYPLAWSPDGTRFAFIANDPTYTDFDVYTMNIDGSDVRKLTTDGKSYRAPSWSPDSKYIAFASQGDPSVLKYIYIMAADGSDQRHLSNTPIGSSEPAWSPDGTKLACRAHYNDIWVMNIDGSNQIKLTGNPVGDYNCHPTWSPDGTRIAFVSYRDGNQEIYVVNADRSGETRLTSENARDWDPAWSPALPTASNFTLEIGGDK